MDSVSNDDLIKHLEELRDIDNCDKKDGYHKLIITDTKQFLMLQLVLYEGKKSRKNLFNFLKLEIKVGGEDKEYDI